MHDIVVCCGLFLPLISLTPIFHHKLQYSCRRSSTLPLLVGISVPINRSIHHPMYPSTHSALTQASSFVGQSCHADVLSSCWSCLHNLHVSSHHPPFPRALHRSSGPWTKKGYLQVGPWNHVVLPPVLYLSSRLFLYLLAC